MPYKQIKNGGNLKNFIPITKVTVDNTKTQHSIQYSTQHNYDIDRAYISEGSEQNTIHNSQYSYQTKLLDQIIQALQIAIGSKMNPPDPLWSLERLERASSMGWELTTSQVKELIGASPNCDRGRNSFRRGSFVFVKSGKIGRQTSWKIERLYRDENTALRSPKTESGV